MENQHRHIRGYRDLTPEDIALMNEIKAAGAAMLALVAKVNERSAAQYCAAEGLEFTDKGAELDRLRLAEPKRWAAMARTDFQTGVMKLVRAVAQPTDC